MAVLRQAWRAMDGGVALEPTRAPGAARVAGVTAGALGLAFVLAHMPWLAAGTVFGAVLLTLVFMRPLLVVGAILLIGPLDLSFLTGGYKGLFEGAGGLDMNGIRILALVGGFSLLILYDRRLLRTAFGPYARWYVAFLAFAVLSLLYSDSRLDGARFLMKLTYPFVIFVVVLGAVETRRQLDRLADLAILGVALATMVLNPFYVMSGGYLIDETIGTRVGGLGVHVAAWSFYLLIMMMIALVRFSVRRQRRYLLLGAVCAVWIVLALTRSTLLAALGALALVALYSALVERDFRLLGAASVAGAALAVALWPAFMSKTFGANPPSLLELLRLLTDPVALFNMVSMSGREIVWPVIFVYFLSSPFIGLGLGTTTLLMQTEFPPIAGGVVHNEYLRLAAETGVVGLGLFALAIAAWWAGALRAAFVRRPQVKEWALPSLAALTIWGITGLSDNSIDYYTSVSQYVAVLAAGAIWWVRAETEGGEADETGRVETGTVRP